MDHRAPGRSCPCIASIERTTWPGAVRSPGVMRWAARRIAVSRLRSVVNAEEAMPQYRARPAQTPVERARSLRFMPACSRDRGAGSSSSAVGSACWRPGRGGVSAAGSDDWGLHEHEVGAQRMSASEAALSGSNALRAGAVALSLLLATLAAAVLEQWTGVADASPGLPGPCRDRRRAVRDLGGDRHLVRGLLHLQLPVHGAAVHVPGLRPRRVAEPAAVPHRRRGHRPADGPAAGPGRGGRPACARRGCPRGDEPRRGHDDQLRGGRGRDRPAAADRRRDGRRVGDAGRRRHGRPGGIGGP